MCRVWLEPQCCKALRELDFVLKGARGGRGHILVSLVVEGLCRARRWEGGNSTLGAQKAPKADIIKNLNPVVDLNCDP